MTLACKIFPNEQAARGAANAAEAGWTPPTLTNIGLPPHADHATLVPQRLAAPSELSDGRWIVYGDHPSFKGDTVLPSEIKRNARAAEHINGVQQAAPGKPQKRDEAIEVEPVGAESGVVERPGKAKARTA